MPEGTQLEERKTEIDDVEAGHRGTEAREGMIGMVVRLARLVDGAVADRLELARNGKKSRLRIQRKKRESESLSSSVVRHADDLVSPKGVCHKQ